jgi:hypothetical protein
MHHPFSLETHETLRQHASRIRVGEQTRTHSLIKPPLDGLAEFPVVFRLDFLGPRLGMILQPFRTLVRPVLQQGLWQ